ncbi:MAG: YqaE/Pmp3 family membrane protein [Desulfobulbaceae bacterium]|nr:MAG: YqaE/Pmp3 family membrane protein [Desulfobulbaceae bacterium]
MNKLLLIILAILLPPLAVFIKKGAGKDLVINILLCIIIWIPAIIHGVWVVASD